MDVTDPVVLLPAAALSADRWLLGFPAGEM
jgi:hypothetical protein